MQDNTATPPQGPIINNQPNAAATITTAGDMALAGAAGAGYRQPPLELEIGGTLPVEWTNQVREKLRRLVTQRCGVF
jgi:hypothetical protein